MAYLVRRLLLVVIVLACIALSWMGLPLLRGDWVADPAATNPVLSAGDSARQRTAELLAAVIAHPAGNRPADLPNYLQVGEVCWKRLQAAVALNAGQYSLAVLSVSDSSQDPQATQRLVQVYIQVSFADGTAYKVLDANDHLIDCSQI